MVKHIILWTLNDMEKDKKETVKQEIKKSLESLNGKIPGLIDLKITASETLSSSTADLMLDSTFESPYCKFKSPAIYKTTIMSRLPVLKKLR